MSDYNATYTISGTAQPARVSLLKEKAAIQLYTPEETQTVYWLYHEITQDAANTSLFFYMAYPPQLLEVLDKPTVEALVTRLTQSKKGVVKKRNRVIITLFAGCVFFFAALYFLLLPWMATIAAARVPVTYEKELGDAMFQTMKRDSTLR